MSQSRIKRLYSIPVTCPRIVKPICVDPTCQEKPWFSLKGVHQSFFINNFIRDDEIFLDQIEDSELKLRFAITFLKPEFDHKSKIIRPELKRSDTSCSDRNYTSWPRQEGLNSSQEPILFLEIISAIGGLDNTVVSLNREDQLDIAGHASCCEDLSAPENCRDPKGKMMDTFSTMSSPLP